MAINDTHCTDRHLNVKKKKIVERKQWSIYFLVPCRSTIFFLSSVVKHTKLMSRSSVLGVNVICMFQQKFTKKTFFIFTNEAYFTFLYQADHHQKNKQNHCESCLLYESWFGKSCLLLLQMEWGKVVERSLPIASSVEQLWTDPTSVRTRQWVWRRDINIDTTFLPCPSQQLWRELLEMYREMLVHK